MEHFTEKEVGYLNRDVVRTDAQLREGLCSQGSCKAENCLKKNKHVAAVIEYRAIEASLPKDAAGKPYIPAIQQMNKPEGYSEMCEGVTCTCRLYKEWLALQKPVKKPRLASDFIERFKANAVEGGYSAAATQLTNGLQYAAVEAIKKNAGDNRAAEAACDLLQTKAGSVAVGFIAGLGMQYVPVLAGNPHAQKLADKLQENSMAAAGNAVMDSLMGGLLSGLGTTLDKLPVPKTENSHPVSEPEKVVEMVTQAQAPANSN